MTEAANLVIKITSTDAVKAAENLDKVTAAGEKTEGTAKRVQRSWEQAIERVAAEANGLNGRFDVLNSTQNKMLAAVERIAAQMNRMAESTNKAAGATSTMAQAATKNAEALDKVDKGARSAASGLDQVDKGAKGAAAGLGDVERKAEASGKQVGILGGLVARAAAAFSAWKIIDSADQWGQLSSRLGIATESTDELVEAQTRLMEISNRAYKDFGNSSELFIRTSESMKELGYSSSQTLDMVEALTYGLVVSAADTQKSSSVIDAWSKSILLGKMGLQEFQTVVAYAPRLQKALADSLGVSNAELMRMVLAGELTTAKLAGVSSQIAIMGAEADKMPVTVRDAMTRLNNSFMQWIGTINDGTGAIGILTAGLVIVSNNIGAVAAIAGTLIAIKAASWLTGLAIAAVTAARGIAAAGLSMSALSKSMGLLGGPVGWAVAAIGLGVTAWELFGKTANAALSDSVRGVTSMNGSLDDMIAKFTELNAVQQRQAVTAKNSQIAEATKQATQALEDLVAKISIVEGTRGAPRIRAAFLSAYEGIVNDATLTQEQVSVQLLALIDKYMSGSKATEDYKGSTLAALDAVLRTGAQVVTYTGQLGAMTAAQDGATGAVNNTKSALLAQQAAMGEFAKQYATNAEKMATEIAKWEKELGGLTDDQRKRIVDRFTPKTGDIKAAASAYATLTAAIAANIAENKLELAVGGKASEAEKLRIKIDQELASGKLKLNAAQKAGVDIALKAMKASESELSMSKMLAAAGKQKLDLSAAAVKSVYDEARQNEELARTFGMSKSAIEAQTIARLQDQLAQKDVLKLSEEEVKALELTIDARKRNAAAMGGIEFKEKQKASWDKWASEVGKIFDNVGRSLTDAIFEGGKSGKELLKDVFKSLTFSVLINPVMGALQGAVTNSLGGAFGFSNPSQGGSAASSGMGIMNMLSTAKTAYSAFTGALTSSLAQGMGTLGSMFGSTAASSFAAGMTSGSALGGMGIMGAGATAGSVGAAGSVATGATSAGAMGAGSAASSMSLMGPLAIIAAVVANSALYKQGWDATNGSLNPGVDVVFGGATGTIHKALEGLGMGGYMASMLSGSAITSKLFGMKNREYGDTSIVGSFNPDERFGGRYETPWTQKGGIFRSNKSGKKLEAIDDDMLISLGNTFDLLKIGAAGLASSVGVSAADLATFSESINVTLTSDASENNRRIQEVFAGMADNMVRHLIPAIADYAIESETATQTLGRLGSTLASVNSVFDVLGLSAYETSLHGASLAVSLSDLLGGMEGFAGATNFYYENFRSEAERAAKTTEQLTAAFAGLDKELPASRVAFDDIVKSLDLTSTAGQQAFAALMGLAPAFASVTLSAEQLAQEAAAIAQQKFGLENQLLQLQGDTVEIRRRELAALDESNHALQEQIWSIEDLAVATQAATAARQQELDVMYAMRAAAETAGSNAMAALTNSVNAKKSELQQAFDAIAKTLNDSISTSQTAISTLESMANRLRSTLDTMRGQTDDAASRAWAQAQISQARIAGVAPDTKDFEQALSIVSKPSEGLFATFEDYQLDFLKTANDIFALSDITGKQLTIEQQTLATLKDQLRLETSQFDQEMQKYDEMVTLAQQQLDVALGNNNILLTIPAALAAIAAAIAGIQLTAPANYMSQNKDVADAFANGSYGTGLTAEQTAANHYAVHGAGEGRDSAGLVLGKDLQYLVNNPDVAQAYASGQYGTGLSPEDVARLHYEQFGRGEGRSFAVGTSYVPHDMQANIHQGEIIIDPRSSDILRRYGIGVQGGGNQSSDIKLLQQEIRELRLMLQAQLDESNRNTRQTAEGTTRMVDGEGVNVRVQGVVPTVAAIPGQ